MKTEQKTVTWEYTQNGQSLEKFVNGLIAVHGDLGVQCVVPLAYEGVRSFVITRALIILNVEK